MGGINAYSAVEESIGVTRSTTSQGIGIAGDEGYVGFEPDESLSGDYIV